MNVLKLAPHFANCDTPEPSLEALIRRYYRIHFDEPKATEYANRYLLAVLDAQLGAAMLNEARIDYLYEQFAEQFYKPLMTKEEWLAAIDAQLTAQSK